MERRNDPFKKLEHVQKDKEAARAKDPLLQQLINISDKYNKDNYELSCKLKKKI